MPDNVTDELKPASQTSYARIFMASLLLGPLLLLALVWLANVALPVTKADAFEGFLYTTLTAVVSIFGGGTAVGGLARTIGKITTQKAKATAQMTPLEAGVAMLPPQYQGYADMAGRLLQKDDDSDVPVQDDEAVADDGGVQL